MWLKELDIYLFYEVPVIIIKGNIKIIIFLVPSNFLFDKQKIMQTASRF